ncbi:MAG TPA: lipoprotein signal peptidase, partial [Erwiniaceae bacterium]|nr:lipoprotein signal peptidase [Erwiniaceae bacterium]
MRKSLSATGLRWLWLVLVVIAVDFASKQWVLDNLALHETMPVMPFFNLFHAHNYGAAFSFLADKGGWQRWFF